MNEDPQTTIARLTQEKADFKNDAMILAGVLITYNETGSSPQFITAKNKALAAHSALITAPAKAT